MITALNIVYIVCVGLAAVDFIRACYGKNKVAWILILIEFIAVFMLYSTTEGSAWAWIAPVLVGLAALIDLGRPLTPDRSRTRR